MSTPERKPAIGDAVLINVPHLGLVSGHIVAICQEPRPTACVHWLADTMDLIELSRLEDNGRHGWYVTPKLDRPKR